MRSITLASLALISLSACGSAPSGQDDSQGSHTLDGALDFPTDIDLPSWVQSADDFIEGTVVSVSAAWDPLGHRVGTQFSFIGVADCVSGSPALEVVLTDVRSIYGRNLPDPLTVRLGHGSYNLPGLVKPEVQPGETQVESWSGGGEAPFTPGMRIGGPIYEVPHHDDPVFPTGFRQPIYRVLDGTVEFAVPAALPTIPLPVPAVEPLQGLDPQAAWMALLQASVEPLAPLASTYRAYLRLDDPTVTHTYAAVCHFDDEWEPDPCDDTGVLRPEDCR